MRLFYTCNLAEILLILKAYLIIIRNIMQDYKDTALNIDLDMVYVEGVRFKWDYLQQIFAFFPQKSVISRCYEAGD